MARTRLDLVVRVMGDGDQAQVLESLRRAVGSGVTVDIIDDRIGGVSTPPTMAVGVP